MTATEDTGVLENAGSTSGVLHVAEFQGRLHDLDVARTPRPSTVSRLVHALFLAGTAGTATMTAGAISFPAMDFRSPGSVAHVWIDHKRRRRRITAVEARAMALRVMEETERRLHQDRVGEAALLMQLFDDEELATV